MTTRPPGAAAPASGRSFWLVAILGLAALAILIALGTWQVQRLHWKEALLATITTVAVDRAVPVTKSGAGIDAITSPASYR